MFDGAALLKLDAVHAGQVIEAMVQYCGTRWQTIQEVVVGFEAAQGHPIANERWDGIALPSRQPCYEYWVQGAGDGALFEYGTDPCDNWLGSTQHRFESHGDQDPATRARVAALQAAADQAGGGSRARVAAL